MVAVQAKHVTEAEGEDSKPLGTAVDLEALQIVLQPLGMTRAEPNLRTVRPKSAQVPPLGGRHCWTFAGRYLVQLHLARACKHT